MTQVASRLMNARQMLQQGKFAQARALLTQCLQKDPNEQNALVMMRFCLAHMGEHQQALFYARKAAGLFPDNADIQTNLASSYASLGDQDQALKAAQRAIEINPQHAQARLALAAMCSGTHRYLDAFEHAREGLRQHSGTIGFAMYAATSLIAMGRADEAARDLRPIAAAFPANYELMIIMASAHMYAAGVDPEEVVACHKTLGRMLANMAPEVKEPFANSRDPERPLRVGLFSADTRLHAVWFFIHRFVELYDRSKMRLTVYTNFAGMPDEHTKILRASAERDSAGWEVPAWRDISRMDHDKAMRRIRDDGIDVLIDATGYTQGHGMPMFAMRAAPVQATAWGYPLTTGLPTMDYRITDALIDPPGCEREHSEKLIRLGDCFYNWSPGDGAPEVNPVPPSQRPGAQGITFGSFTSMQKLNDQTCRLWARIIRDNPGSRMLLKTVALKDQRVRAATAHRFEINGMDMSRLTLEGPQIGGGTLLSHYDRIDIALDTWPYSGMTTLCEATYMGVPFVTRVGPLSVGRAAAAIARNIGLDDLIAFDDDAYAGAASRLARDPARLASLRSSLRDRVRQSPIMDAPANCRRMEDAIRAMWREWCAKA